jgi:UDP-N-acetylglucosamine 2-epimerase (non-hydrolysing)
MSMSKPLVAVVAGTRPEAVKMAPVYFSLKQSKRFETVLLATAQHRQMLDQALAAFDLTPDYDLNLMQPGQTLPELTARVIQAVAAWIDQHRPAAILVQGDTSTVLSTAIAAFYQRVPIGHVEAGLRTGDMLHPFPEEMNRRLTSPLARWHFCPTEFSRQNLLKENIHDGLYVTGNTVVDALQWIRRKLQGENSTSAGIAARLKIPVAFSQEFLDQGTRRWILVTGHRRESFGEGFERICRAIDRLTRQHPELGVLYPVHLNPHVREPVQRILGQNPRIALVEPAGYQDFVWLMDRCHFILSDSGGVQEEAPSLGKPVLVMRDTTERPEGVAAGTCRLVGTDIQRILDESSMLLDDPVEYERRSKLANPYGDGTAADRIRKILEDELGGT